MNEQPLVRYMRENFRFFGGMSILYGLVFAFCLYRNLNGITLPVCVAVTIWFGLLFMKQIHFTLQRRSIPYLAGMMLLGISSAYTSSRFFECFNLLGILLLFLVFMMHQFYTDYYWNLPGYLKRLCILIGTTAGCIPKFYEHGVSRASGGNTKKSYTLAAVGIGLLAALAVLCVVLPLLLKSDFMFAKIFGRILKYINFTTIFGISLTFLAGMTFCYAFFCGLCRYNLPADKERTLKRYNPIIGITFSGVISVIYLLYCMIQIVYLFARVQFGLPEGMSYAKYARGGFWELLFVSVVNFIIVLVCMYLFSENMILKILLSVISGCTYIMIFSAAYRMILYIGAYHLTFFRILVLWFLIVLAFVMAGVIISIYRKGFPLFRYFMTVVGVCYILFSFSRADAYIVRYNVSHTEQLKGEDVKYFMNNLSRDAAPEIAKIDVKDVDVSDYYYDRNDLEETMARYFYDIEREYDDVYFRKANYSKIRARISAKRYLESHHGYEKYWWYEE